MNHKQITIDNMFEKKTYWAQYVIRTFQKKLHEPSLTWLAQPRPSPTRVNLASKVFGWKLLS